MQQNLAKKLFRVSWIVYFVSYIGRLNYAASMIEIGQSEGYTTIQIGTIVTALFISYGIGQLISGLIGDHCSPRKLVLTGLIGCGLCNLAMYGSNSYWQLVLIWSINGLCLAFVWPPIVKLYTQYMTPEYLHKSCFNIQTSVAMGTCFTYILCSGLLRVANWRTIFLMSAILLFGVALLWQLVIKKLERDNQKVCVSQEGAKHVTESKQSACANEATEIIFSKVILQSGLIIIFIAILIMGFLKDGIMTWVPQYITDTFGTHAYFSVFLTALLPLVNLSGIYLIKYIHSKNAGDDLKTTAVFYGVSLISLSLLVLFGTTNIYISVLLFAIVTSCMLGINTILVSVLPTYFAKYNKTALVAGLTNCVTYLGSGLCGYGLGVLVEGYGWQVTSMILVGICLLGILSCLGARPMWKKFKN
ncbi:MAG: MFS transporter [Niameybacter sp.]|uniref:MFS transporter n=1 Tax=Niameybacter sp. TaxID=2033640 RepID=UPI002FC94CEE